MASQIVRYTKLSADERRGAAALPDLGAADRVELRVRGRDGGEQTMMLPAAAADIVGAMLARLLGGESIAVLADDQEVSPTEAAGILGISRPLVVHRMDTGDLPFRYVGTHRRSLVRDVLALKARLDRERGAVEALAEDARDLHARYRA